MSNNKYKKKKPMIKPAGYRISTYGHCEKGHNIVVGCQQLHELMEKTEVDLTGIFGRENITGLYEDVNNRFSFSVNQAGKHIECFSAEVVTAQYTGNRNLYRYSGVLKDDGVTFDLFQSKLSYSDFEKKNTIGQLKVIGHNRLAVFFDDYSKEFSELIFIDHRPTLSESYADILFSDKEHDLLMMLNWFPLLRSQIAQLSSSLSSKKIGSFLQKFYEPDGFNEAVKQVNRRKHASELDRWIGRVFTTNAKYPNAWHKSDLEQVIYHGRRLLFDNWYKYAGEEASLLCRIQEVLDRVDMEWIKNRDKKDMLPNIRNLLRMHPGKRIDQWGDPMPPYYYKMKMKIIGIPVGVGVASAGLFDLSIKIDKYISKNIIGKSIDTLKASGVIGEVGVGVSKWEFNIGREDKFEAESHVDYSTEDLFGVINAVGASTGAGGGKYTYNLGNSVVTFQGNGSKPVFSLHSEGLDDQVVYGWRSSVGLSQLHGRAWEEMFYKYKKRPPDYIVKTKTYELLHTKNSSLYFELGSTVLSDVCMMMIRMFCALELYSFWDITSRIYLKGYADRIDEEADNYRLSLVRAQNVFQAIQNILGEQFKFKKDPIGCEGIGEKAASNSKGVKDADNTPNPEYRKVEIILNNQLILVLENPTTKKKPKKTY